MSKRKQQSIFESFAKFQKLSRSDTTLPSAICTLSPPVPTDVEPDSPKKPASRQVESDQYDISVIAKRSHSLTDQDRHTLLTNRFKPHQSWKGPLREFGKKMRRVPALVFDTEKYPSLSYSPLEDSVYCADCVAFSKAKVTLVSKPLTDWANAKKFIDGHLLSSDHKTAATRAREYINVCSKKQDSIPQQLSQAYMETVERNRNALTSIIKTIILCGKQNIPLRKGNDESTSNFIALINHRAETDQHLKEHLEKAPQNARYLSPKIQNELIEHCAKPLIDDITKECKEAHLYTILVDESADVSTTEQISICLRYVVREFSHHVIKEQFLCFLPTRDTTGETLTKEVTHHLTKLGLDACMMVGQGYDGAANMSSDQEGVQGRIKKEHPSIA
jgi:hypothetical protein